MMKAAKREKEPKPKINYISIDRTGKVYLNRQETNVAVLLEQLIQMRLQDADLNVVIRGDKKTKHKYIMRVLEVLQQANIGKVNMATDPKSTDPKSI